MPTPTYIALATLTLTGNDSIVEFSSIPNTYRDLVLVAEGNHDGNAVPLIRFNGVTTNSYYQQSMSYNAAIRSVDSQFQLPYADWGAASTDRVSMLINIFDYSATDKNKTVLIRTTRWDNNVAMHACRFESNNAITTIRFTANGGNMTINSTFSLYGIVS